MKKLEGKYFSSGLLAFMALWVMAFTLFMPNPVEAFLQGYPYLFVGFGGAVIGNLTALGGGLVFIPILIMIAHVPPVLALKSSILSQTFGMSSGAIAWNRNKKIPWQLVPWAIPGLIVGSTFSTLIVHPNAMLVKGLFGPVSILLGLLLLCTLYRKTLVSETHYTLAVKCAVALGALVGGVITGWVAIGEGELVSATLMLLFGFATEGAIALGVCLLAISSIYLGFIHTFVLGGVPWNIIAFTIPGCVLGGRLAPRLACHVNPRLLKSSFAIVAILDGAIFIAQYFWSTH